MVYRVRSIFRQLRTRKACQRAIAAADRAIKRPATAQTFTTIIARVLNQFSRLSLLVGFPTTDNRDYIEILLLEMAHAQNVHGFTFAPAVGPNGMLPSPQEGHCVALPGTNFNANNTSSLAGYVAVDESKVRRWIDYMEPALNTGYAWIGGFPASNNIFDLEASVVFLSTEQEVAHRAAETWRQHSYWTVDLNHQDGGSETELGLMPCGSVLAALLAFQGE